MNTNNADPEFADQRLNDLPPSPAAMTAKLSPFCNGVKVGLHGKKVIPPACLVNAIKGWLWSRWVCVVSPLPQPKRLRILLASHLQTYLEQFASLAERLAYSTDFANDLGDVPWIEYLGNGLTIKRIGWKLDKVWHLIRQDLNNEDHRLVKANNFWLEMPLSPTSHSDEDRSHLLFNVSYATSPKALIEIFEQQRFIRPVIAFVGRLLKTPPEGAVPVKELIRLILEALKQTFSLESKVSGILTTICTSNHDIIKIPPDLLNFLAAGTAQGLKNKNGYLFMPVLEPAIFLVSANGKPELQHEFLDRNIRFPEWRHACFERSAKEYFGGKAFAIVSYDRHLIDPRRDPSEKPLLRAHDLPMLMRLREEPEWDGLSDECRANIVRLFNIAERSLWTSSDLELGRLIIPFSKTHRLRKQIYSFSS